MPPEDAGGLAGCAFGRMHARPLDDATPLDGKRKAIAILALIVFVVTFTPLPLTIIP